MISLLCPTRSRPELAKRLIESYQENTSNLSKNQLLFYLQSNDPSIQSYLDIFNQKGLKEQSDFIVEPHYPTSYMWNRLSDIAHGDLLCLMGDDVSIETKDWDLIVEESAKLYEDKVFVMATNDGRSDPSKDLGCPHPIIHKRWKEILGFFMPPMFMHRYLDTYTTNLAKSLNRYIQLPEISFRHYKEAQMNDATGQLSRSWIGYDQYNHSISKRYFDCDLEALRKHLK